MTNEVKQKEMLITIRSLIAGGNFIDIDTIIESAIKIIDKVEDAFPTTEANDEIIEEQIETDESLSDKFNEILIPKVKYSFTKISFLLKSNFHIGTDKSYDFINKAEKAGIIIKNRNRYVLNMI